VADSVPNDGEAPVIVGMADAAMHMYGAAIVALSGVRKRYDELMENAATGPNATLGQRLYVARGRAKLSTKEAANGVGLRKDLIAALGG
jgi:hypothetical protein